MSSSPERMTLTEKDSHIEPSRENSNGGFTAVNGHGSSPRMSQTNGGLENHSQTTDVTAQSHTQDRDDWHHSNANGDSVPSSEHATDARPHESPIINSTKRRRVELGSPIDGPGPNGRIFTPASSSPEQAIDSHHYNSSHTSAQRDMSRPTSGDDAANRMAEALRSESESTVDRAHSNGAVNTPTQPEGLITTNAGVHVDPKKRKRAFTNRTKTGCQTCRRRKKKCDEAKPTCQNCARGGFVCEGYTLKRDLASKNGYSHKSSPVAIQAAATRNGFYEGGPMHPRPFRSGAYDATLQPIQDNHGRQGLDDNLGPRVPPPNSWSSPSVTPGHRPLTQDPSSEVPRPLPLPNHNAASRFGSSFGSNMLSFSPIAAAQRALDHNSATRGQEYRAPSSLANNIASRAAKDCMLRGELFNPRDEQILAEKGRCHAACFRFNKKADPAQQNSASEIDRSFRQIVEPESPSVRPTSFMQEIQRVGVNVHVEPPFRCDFGYNLRIGENVTIYGGCVISDPCDVIVGSNTVIGQNVQIVGCVVTPQPSERGFCRGYRIRIGQNVHIGAGAIIAPDELSLGRKTDEITIGDNAWIAPGCVITGEVGANTIVQCKNTEIARGIPYEPVPSGPHAP